MAGKKAVYEEIAKVISHRKILPDIYLLELETHRSAAKARPGQFAMLKVTPHNGCMLRRPLSIHRAAGNRLFFLYSVTGKGTQLLSRVKKGETLSIIAPLGKGFQLPGSKADILLVAGGRGIAPLFFLAEKAREKGHHVTLLAGARSAACLYPGSSLPSGIDAHIATEDGSSGLKGKITELFVYHLEGKSHVYACGPLDMYKAILELTSSWQKARNGRVLEVQVSLEARMACGVGACYGCAIKTRSGARKVCSDGPVFNIQEILWDELRE